MTGSFVVNQQSEINQSFRVCTDQPHTQQGISQTRWKGASMANREERKKERNDSFREMLFLPHDFSRNHP